MRSLARSRQWFVQAGLALAGLGLVAGCSRLPWGRPPGKLARIGVLSSFAADAPAALRYREAFLAGLSELGYEDGRSAVIEFRYSEGRLERASAQATDLVRLPVDVIVLSGDVSMAAARQATQTIPIIF